MLHNLNYNDYILLTNNVRASKSRHMILVIKTTI